LPLRPTLSPYTTLFRSQHRFDRATERVMAAIRSGDLGRLTSGVASCAWWRAQSYYDAGRWRGTWAMDGGGAIMNQTIHMIDLLRSEEHTSELQSRFDLV